MATQQSKGALAGFLPEVSPEAAEANRRYIEAQRKLAETLDVRKNRTFDPMWLAAAKGFLGPTSTGSAFEAFGKVAENLEGAQAKEQELAKTVAGQELELAAAGLGLERMRLRDQAFQQALGQGDPTRTTLATGTAGALPGVPTSGAALPPSVVRKPTAPPAGGALPAAQPQAQGALPSAQPQAQGISPPSFQDLPGDKVAPGIPNLMSGLEFINIARFSDPNADPAKIIKEANELDRNRFQVKDKGVFDLKTGRFHEFSTGQQPHEFAYSGRTINIPSQDSVRLNNAWSMGDWKTYWDIAKKYGIERPEGAPSGAVLNAGALPGRAPAAGAPAAGAPAAPARAPFRSTSEAAAEAKEAETVATERARASVKKEETLESDLATADKIGFITTQAMDQINSAPDLLGILQKPGVGAALGRLVTEGIKIGQTSIGIPAVEDAIRAVLPAADQPKLNSIASLAGNLAELELLYTQLYIKGQGAVTEGERAVVRRIPGTTSTNPDVLKEKMTLLQKRAEFDRKRVEAFKEYVEQNPRGSYLKFERSDDFKRLREEYNEDLYRTFNLPRPGKSSTPSAPAAPATPRAPAGGGTSSDILREAQRRRAQQGGGQ